MDEDFEYENRLEHQILWPPTPACPGCGGPEEHVQIPCDGCGEHFCKPKRILSDKGKEYCSKACLKENEPDS